jgi:hypothetical protein
MGKNVTETEYQRQQRISKYKATYTLLLAGMEPFDDVLVAGRCLGGRNTLVVHKKLFFKLFPTL